MNKLDLGAFFPESMLQIKEVKQKEETIHIYLKSEMKGCNCPKCGQSTEQYHGTYVRTVQDLPILGKTVKLHIRAQLLRMQFNCNNN